MEYDKQTKVKLPNMLKISWDTSVINYVPTKAACFYMAQFID